MSRRERPRPTTRRPEFQESALRSGAAARGRPERARAAPVADRRFFQALLPLRFFVGATFLYAGIDKFLDPRFLNSAGPGSIAEQLIAFTHESPLAGLVTVFALPNPIFIGVLMAIGEIAIGLGALTGLLYRASAAGGARGLAALLPDRVVERPSLLLRAGPTLRGRMADAGSRRQRRPGGAPRPVPGVARPGRRCGGGFPGAPGPSPGRTDRRQRAGRGRSGRLRRAAPRSRRGRAGACVAVAVGDGPGRQRRSSRRICGSGRVGSSGRRADRQPEQPPTADRATVHGPNERRSGGADPARRWQRRGVRRRVHAPGMHGPVRLAVGPAVLSLPRGSVRSDPQRGRAAGPGAGRAHRAADRRRQDDGCHHAPRLTDGGHLGGDRSLGRQTPEHVDLARAARRQRLDALVLGAIVDSSGRRDLFTRVSTARAASPSAGYGIGEQASPNVTCAGPSWDAPRQLSQSQAPVLAGRIPAREPVVAGATAACRRLSARTGQASAARRARDRSRSGTGPGSITG